MLLRPDFRPWERARPRVPSGAPRARHPEISTGLRPHFFPIAPRERVAVRPRADALPGTFHFLFHRNPLLDAACFKAGYIDAWGRGIEKMTHACEAAGLPTPTFESNSGGVLATFTLHPASVEPVVSKKTTPEVGGKSEG